MRTTINIILIIILLSLLIFTPTSLIVLAASNITDIDVNVSTFSQITLNPDYLNWTNIVAGTAGGHKNITVKNTGSVNVSAIYGWVDTLEDETIRPYGSENPASFAAGGVLTIKNETDEKYFYLGRIEWNWTQDIPSHDWSAVTSPIAWGYFRNISNDYVWVLGNGTGGRCNESNAQFAIEADADLGTTPTRTPTPAITLTTITAAPKEWAYAQITSGILADHCIAAFYNCSKVFIYNFDRRSNFTDCGEYLYNAQLSPGNTIILKVDAWVPRGIPAGNLTRATLTIETS